MTKQTVTAEETKSKTFRFPVSNGIFAHYPRLKDSIWLLLYYIDKTTREVDDGDGNFVGLVLGGSPRRDSDVAADFGCDKRTICRWRNTLASEGYIEQRITPYGAVVKLKKSKKRGIASGTNMSHPGTQNVQGGTRFAQGGTQTALAKKTEQDFPRHNTKTGESTWFSIFPTDLQKRVREAGEEETAEWASPPRNFEAWFTKHKSRLALAVVDEEIYFVKERVGDYEASDKAAREVALEELRKMRAAIPKPADDEGELLSDEEFNRAERERLFGAKEAK